jgi:predicted RNA-binding protein with PIN domain
MIYLIDGYNLIGSTTHILLSDTNKEKKLIDYVNQKLAQQKSKAIIVFDGKNPIEIYGSVYEKIKCKVVFTNPDETADDYIIRYLNNEKNKSSLTMVSSDKQLVVFARQLRIASLTSPGFLNKLSKYQSQNQVIKRDDPMQKRELSYWLSVFKSKDI